MFGTDAGRRVLCRIAAICDPVMITPAQANDHGVLAFQAGMRFAMHQINLSYAGRGAATIRRDEA